MADFSNYLCETYKIEGFQRRYCTFLYVFWDLRKWSQHTILSNPDFYDSIIFSRDKKKVIKLWKYFFDQKKHLFLASQSILVDTGPDFLKNKFSHSLMKLRKRTTRNFSKLKNKICQIAKCQRTFLFNRRLYHPRIEV